MTDQIGYYLKSGQGNDSVTTPLGCSAKCNTFYHLLLHQTNHSSNWNQRGNILYTTWGSISYHVLILRVYRDNFVIIKLAINPPSMTSKRLFSSTYYYYVKGSTFRVCYYHYSMQRRLPWKLILGQKINV